MIEKNLTVLIHKTVILPIASRQSYPRIIDFSVVRRRAGVFIIIGDRRTAILYVYII